MLRWVYSKDSKQVCDMPWDLNALKLKKFEKITDFKCFNRPMQQMGVAPELFICVGVWGNETPALSLEGAEQSNLRFRKNQIHRIHRL